ncbi:hypothetical protein C900_02656 [Fulvivirga imtechensis AK7]|uniref:D-serine dehydratase-like domain-containing protein n=2 Tax=Fulvivirga TaxID=396811 RepID=L8JWW7_9BACT|nr:hypothetical protein C900_02656 [Fulvivirga imtechensis AK7]
MCEKARRNDLIFRPHFKTHQSKKVGEWFRQEGVEAITVSSLGMATYFAEAGWKEITVAFPVNLLQIDVINALASHATVNLLADDRDVIVELDSMLTYKVHLFIEIDSGGGRTGIPHSDLKRISSMVATVTAADNINLKGFYTHAGHSYDARSKDDIRKVFSRTVQCMQEVRQWAESNDLNVEFCMGDTPGCSVGERFDEIDAISPGNFVFYDVMQTIIGSCADDQIAVAMACPVVSKNAGSNDVCIYGGAVHFSKDSIEDGQKKIFGMVVRLGSNGWSEPLEGCFVKSLSQEHGIVHLSAEEFEQTKIGDVLGVLPVHSCLTAEAMGVYRNFNGELIDHYAQKNRD